MNRFVLFYRRFSPPGMTSSADIIQLAVGFPSAAIFCLGSFLLKYNRASADLESKNLWTNGVMPPFRELLKGSMSGFGVLAAVILAGILFRYVFFHRESKSIYLMRRLPSKTELLKRILVIPAILLGLGAVTAAVTVLLCRFSYFSLTPANQLPAQIEIFNGGLIHA